uniref:Uncharacterized protein n=1 Tax=Pristionchus pacificus TaxID=54126 RepID=A0A2A6BID4_PRIPA|eukprot:PDM65623.1 hypothetical protein PRIPAC_53631 [Pristionchus pacificus]
MKGAPFDANPGGGATLSLRPPVPPYLDMSECSVRGGAVLCEESAPCGRIVDRSICPSPGNGYCCIIAAYGSSALIPPPTGEYMFMYGAYEAYGAIWGGNIEEWPVAVVAEWRHSSGMKALGQKAQHSY